MAYFLYDGKEARMSRDYKIEGYRFVGDVLWKGTAFVVKLYFKGMVLMSKVTFNKEKELLHIYSILKSNLQKQIRRQDAHAVTTCAAMLDLDSFECLRRLAVIAFEDVEISKETSVIVWLMAACSKGFVLTPSSRKFILNYVFSLVSHPTCMRLELDKHEEKVLEKSLSIADIFLSDYEDKEYLAGIFFRISYGGLTGDLPMIERLTKHILVNKIPLKTILITNSETYPLVFHPACVDFHNYPTLLQIIHSDLSGKFSLEEIKKVIWKCSSGINTRHLENSEELGKWKIIQPVFAYHTQYYLNKITS